MGAWKRESVCQTLPWKISLLWKLQLLQACRLTYVHTIIPKAGVWPLWKPVQERCGVRVPKAGL